MEINPEFVLIFALPTFAVLAGVIAYSFAKGIERLAATTVDWLGFGGGDD